MVLQTNTEKCKDGASKPWTSVKENRNKRKIYTQNREKTAEIPRIHNDEEELEKLNSYRDFEGKRSKERQRVTYLTNGCLNSMG